MAAVTICSDFGAPKNKVYHCFHCFSIYLPWSDGTGCHDLCFLNEGSSQSRNLQQSWLKLPLGDSSWTTPQPEDPASLSHFCSFTCFPGGSSGKKPTCQCKRHKRHGFNPWVQKIPWRRKWQSTSVFLPGKSHGQRSLVGYSLWGRQELDSNYQLNNNKVILLGVGGF